MKVSCLESRETLFTIIVWSDILPSRCTVGSTYEKVHAWILATTCYYHSRRSLQLMKTLVTTLIHRHQSIVFASFADHGPLINKKNKKVHPHFQLVRPFLATSVFVVFLFDLQWIYQKPKPKQQVWISSHASGHWQHRCILKGKEDQTKL